MGRNNEVNGTLRSGTLCMGAYPAMKRTRKAIDRARKNKPIRQVAAIPYRISAAGELQILLITSRTTGRFIVPKGWPQKRRSDRKTAALEALEEAGAIGRIHKRSIGRYRYWKRLGRSFVPVVVAVHLLSVDSVRPDWKEARSRRRAWLTPFDAARLVDEPQLVTLLNGLAFEALAPTVPR